MRGDALSGHGLTAALEGVEIAYYLIHSMERTPASRSPFVERELLAAENFATAATAAGVRRLVYLGGLVPHSDTHCTATAIHSAESPPARVNASRHLASREHVEHILLGAVGDSLALRASIVIGARSRSFPPTRAPGGAHASAHAARVAHLPHPANRCPRRDRDAACLRHHTLSGRSLDIGGPNVLSYGDMLRGIAELMLVNRPTLRLGVNSQPSQRAWLLPSPARTQSWWCH